MVGLVEMLERERKETLDKKDVAGEKKKKKENAGGPTNIPPGPHPMHDTLSDFIFLFNNFIFSFFT
jgi:hypothetical protein